MAAFGAKPLERLKQALLLRCGHAEPLVAHRQRDAHGIDFHPDLDAPAAAVVLDGVGQQVHQQLFERTRVGVHMNRAGRRVRQCDARSARQRREQFEAYAECGAEVDAMQAQHDLLVLDPRQVEQVIDQVEQMSPGILHALHLALLVGVQRMRGVEHEQLGEAEDAVQRVAQFMAGAGQEFTLGATRTVGRVLLALQPFERQALGHVAAGAHQRDGLPGGVAGRRSDELEVAHLCVGPAYANACRRRRSARDGLSQRLACRRPVIPFEAAQPVVEREVGQRMRQAMVGAGAPIERHAATAQVERGDADMVGLGRQFPGLLGLAQRQLDALALGDVGGVAVPHHTAVGRYFGQCARLDPAGFATRQHDPILGMPGPDVARRGGKLRHHAGGVVAVHAVGHQCRVGARGLGAEAEQHFGRRAQVEKLRQAIGAAPRPENHPGHLRGDASQQ